MVSYYLTYQIGCQLLPGDKAMETLSVKEAMEQLHVSETTVRRMIKRGELPNAYKQDRKIATLFPEFRKSFYQSIPVCIIPRYVVIFGNTLPV